MIRCSLCKQYFDQPEPYGTLSSKYQADVQEYCYQCYMTIWRMSLVKDWSVNNGTPPTKEWEPIRRKADL